MRALRFALALMVLASMQVKAQKNIQFRSNIQYPRILANIWGYTDTATGKEYALVGVETGMSIVDVSDPDNPFQVFFVPADTSVWQEPKTWSHYAYMTNERGGGLLIVDLGNLPQSVNYTKWSGIPDENYQTTHSCFIDENGIIYLNGSNLFSRGSIMCDLKPDPMNPVYLGQYDEYYVHDCYARNDTLYAAEIMNGTFAVVDVHDKANPVTITRQQTPYNFSHNVWLDSTGRYLFNTDEKKFAPVTVYDISDLNNIKEIDQYRHSDVDSSIVHNTYYHNGYLYTSYYRDGVTICDAHRPDNLVEVGHYDTSPFPSFGGFEGCWGVYPFFGSGNIVCSDRQEGLFVLTPKLKRACYLEGTVTQAVTGNPIPGILVEIMGGNRFEPADLFGKYKTGIADSGRYDVRFTDFSNHCNTVIVSNVLLQPGQTTTVDVQLNCSFPSSIESELNQEKHMSVQPSLFSEQTSIFIKSETGNSELTIYNSEGQLMNQYTLNTSETTINWGSHLPSGMYTAHLKTGNALEVSRMVKIQ